ncbi:GNAT family N-acetyltransferase [Paenibacillus filicis]|uniref:GNAT family N-acetyltransferase n=1 Tax=Paenibacillus gyeongsangnamensis TaxID=3388067 RepID=A0ABT4QHD0_9BACL|nr:GNAT family N-acetyltransferase [Paenibacillus filicis]MCZ8516266.1 GNAT family N-acetyltransferase [Paenibacillus filicis]
MHIRELQPLEPLPLELLLLADPEAQIVRSYMKRGKCYVMEHHGEVIGTYVLLPTRPHTVELVNLAVRETMQGQGLGRQLIAHALQTSRELGYKTIEVGTGNSSVGQLLLYQKWGFRITGVDRDFFTRHYAEPIVENGIPCVDMIRLQQDL